MFCSLSKCNNCHSSLSADLGAAGLEVETNEAVSLDVDCSPHIYAFEGD
jgi:hypothetical protein